MKDNLRKIKYSISSENNIRNLENEEDGNTQVKTFSWKLINPLIQHKDKIAYVLGRIGMYRPPKVRPKNIIFGGRFSFGKI